MEAAQRRAPDGCVEVLPQVDGAVVEDRMSKNAKKKMKKKERQLVKKKADATARSGPEADSGAANELPTPQDDAVEIQYVDSDSAFSVEPLFSYKINPFTVFYAGSGQRYVDYGEGYGYTETDRQYFLKVQYLFQS